MYSAPMGLVHPSASTQESTSGKIEFAMIRRTTVRNRCDLYVADERQELFKPAGHISFKNLDMVEVKHQLHVWLADLPDDAGRKVCTVEKVTRGIIGV